MEALQGECLLSPNMHRRREWPTQYQSEPFKAELSHDHAVCALWVHPPTSPSLTLFAHIKPNGTPKDVAGRDIENSKSHDGYVQSFVVEGLKLVYDKWSWYDWAERHWPSLKARLVLTIGGHLVHLLSPVGVFELRLSASCCLATETFPLCWY